MPVTDDHLFDLGVAPAPPRERRRPVLDWASRPLIDRDAPPPPPEPFQAPLAGCLAPGGGPASGTSGKVLPVLRCQHFNGRVHDRGAACLAGVPYDQVCDKNRSHETARYPCRPEDESFTTCAKFEINKTLKRVSQLIGQVVLVNISGYVRKQECATLLGTSLDCQKAFIRTVRGKDKVIDLDRVHEFRGHRKAKAKGARA